MSGYRCFRNLLVRFIKFGFVVSIGLLFLHHSPFLTLPENLAPGSEVTIQEAVQQDDPIKEQAAPENQVFKAFRPRNSTASHSHTPTPNVVSSPFLPFSSAECQNKITLLLQNIESSQIWLYEERKLENIYSNFSQPENKDLLANDLNCSVYAFEGKIIRPNFTNIYGHNVHRDPGQNDITLVTQLSLDRLDRLEKLLDYWPGPISAAINTDLHNQSSLKSICSNQHFINRSNIFLHLMQERGKFYPVNRLRNLAMLESPSSHVYLTDIDLLPDELLYKKGLEHLAREGNAKKRAYVVPTFDIYKPEDVDKFTFPESKEKLISLWNSGLLGPVHPKASGHKSTNYNKWKTAQAIYKVRWSGAYEPYLIVQKDEVPRYDDGFVGRNFDKVEHTHVMHLKKFEFYSLHDTFAIHMPHPKPRNQFIIPGCALALYQKVTGQKKKPSPAKPKTH